MLKLLLRDVGMVLLKLIVRLKNFSAGCQCRGYLATILNLRVHTDKGLRRNDRPRMVARWHMTLSLGTQSRRVKAELAAQISGDVSAYGRSGVSRMRPTASRAAIVVLRRRARI